MVLTLVALYVVGAVATWALLVRRWHYDEPPMLLFYAILWLSWIWLAFLYGVLGQVARLLNPIDKWIRKL